MTSFDHCAGVLDEYLARQGSSFAVARDQSREADVPFRVLLVAPPDLGADGDAAHDVMRLLARYRIDAAIEHGAPGRGTGPVV